MPVRAVEEIRPSLRIDAGAWTDAVGLFLSQIQIGVATKCLSLALKISGVYESGDDVAHFFLASQSWSPFSGSKWPVTAD